MLALAACGSDKATPDASIKLIDAPPVDMKIWEDAPPPMYDLSCLNGTPPSTADDPITIAGTTQSFSMGGGASLADVAIDVFKSGDTTPLATTTSDSTGAFATGDIATGAVPIEGYVRAVAPLDQQDMTTHRTTYMYPPSPVAASMTGVPVIMIPNSTFAQVEQFLGAQMDDVNGALLFTVTDCSASDFALIAGATVQVKQGTTTISTVLNLGLASPQLDGTFIATNVPDGDTEILVSYDGMNFPTRTVRAFKRPGQNEAGTLTVTAVRPGP